MHGHHAVALELLIHWKDPPACCELISLRHS
jgi:hypothetical protein